MAPSVATPFAAGLMGLQEEEKSGISEPIIFEGTSCIIDMINFLEYRHQKNKTHLKKGRTHITLYAHNSGAFDSYLVLQTPGIKFKNIIKTAS